MKFSLLESGILENKRESKLLVCKTYFWKKKVGTNSPDLSGTMHNFWRKFVSLITPQYYTRNFRALSNELVGLTLCLDFNVINFILRFISKLFLGNLIL